MQDFSTDEHLFQYLDQFRSFFQEGQEVHYNEIPELQQLTQLKSPYFVARAIDANNVLDKLEELLGMVEPDTPSVHLSIAFYYSFQFLI